MATGDAIYSWPPRRRRFTARRLVAGALLLAGAGPLAATCDRTPAARRARPNVVVISLDSLRADHLGCYGYRSATGAATSPCLDALAAGGVLFEQAVLTTSWTMPSHHALFSGLPDLIHGAITDGHGPTPARVELGRVLADAGYATAGFYSGPYLAANYGFGGGFDANWTDVSGAEEPPDDPGSAGSAGSAEQAAAQKEKQSHLVESAGRVSDAAIAWLEEQARSAPARPFFLFAHYFDIHYDYRPPEELFERMFWPDGRRPRLNGEGFFENPEIRPGMDPADLAGVIAAYDGEIHWTDRQVGRLLDVLDELGLTDDTLVAVVSDHGDEFLEHGAKGHRQNLYQPTLEMALLLRLPGVLPAGKRIPQRVSIVDVAPTILALTRTTSEADALAPPAGVTPGLADGLRHGMWGRDLVPLIDGRETGDRDALAFLSNRWQDPAHPVDTWALWTGSCKVVVTRRYERTENDKGQPVLQTLERTGQVFDLARDADERNDLARSSEPAVLQAITRFDALFAQDGPIFPLISQLPAGPPPRFETPAAAAAAEANLRNLGYVAGPADAKPLPTGTRLLQVLPPPPKFPRSP